jgi:hypothetical protein
MNKEYQFQFESLPNELIIQLFDYIDIRDIFNAFYNLNSRLNQLIQPFQNLRLIISEKQNNRLNYFSSYTDTLIIKDDIYINLKSLINVRHVILYCSYDGILTQINPENFPYLEYFSISNSFLIKNNLYKTLFSNVFNHLKYCNLCGSVSLQAKQTKISIRFLKMGGIDFNIYQIILSSCPNLFYLKFRMLKSDNKSTMHIRSHVNLKQLIIDVEISGWPCNDQLIDQFLELVPNLEQLNVYSSNFISKIQESIIEYDWLASIISNRLLFLRILLFVFRLKWSAMSNQLKDRRILQQLETNFFKLHEPRYQARFVIKVQ